RDDAEGPAAAAAGVVVARGALRGCVPAARRRPARGARAGPPARPVLGEDLLRHRRPRGAGGGRGGRRRAARAALPVPGRAGRGAPAVVPRARGGRLGAGGAAEHGRLARDPPPARGGAAEVGAPRLRRPSVAREPERGLPDGPPARAGPDRQGSTGPLTAAGEAPTAPHQARGHARTVLP